ncbi:hypothetical protein F1C58_16545 (plasmid) [Glaciihabitans sp. INWT7]|uniref:hypothetical protein n=1 Tax=Glaciihabitans sp. INWT7 TaxID=2596912 RepID=UPI001624F0BC|nr:hypothetical protein [Glaciihabitans sp. INWT7]QNE48666.1 hypothetical protein F1C58_16545 [Glaciihabitans sp. INWT7]
MTVIDISGKRRRPREISVQMNTRVSLVTRELLDDVVVAHGITLREAVEMAIEEKWGSVRSDSNASLDAKVTR